MKTIKTLAVLIVSAIFSAAAQNAETKTAVITETQYMLPKRGSEEAFEAAVKAHDKKFHPDGKYKAGLRKVEYGKKAGWYVWVMGPTGYDAIDTRPAKDGGHDADWQKTVDPLIDQYGDVEIWETQPDLSSGIANFSKAKHYEAWAVDLKKGQYYRFKALIEKIKKVYDSMNDRTFLVFRNPIHEAGGADVALLWTFDTYASWGNDNSTRTEYEKMYGNGSWANLLSEWNDIVKDYNSEIRQILPN